jgi:phospholipid/cholesterol/gamma-HCH transport system substrate-binding protein
MSLRLEPRAVAAGALALVVLVLAVVLRGGEGYTLHLRFSNGSQLVKGNLVKVGGVPIGTVRSVELTDDNQADVKIKITDGDYKPLHQGTRAWVRISSLSGVANRYIAIEPGANNAPKLQEGGVIDEAHTKPTIELDAVLSTLDADTRASLQRLSRGSAAAYAGHAREVNRGLVALNPAVAQLDDTLSELDADRPTFEKFIVASAGAINAVATRQSDLSAGLASAAQTATVLADEREELQALLHSAPAALKQTSGTLARTASTLDAIRPAVDETVPVAPRLSRLLADLDPVLDRLGPALRLVNPLLGNLVDYLSTNRGVRQVALPAFSATNAALAAQQPILTGVRDYAPDILLGLTNGFGGTAAGPYDANGSYASIGAEFGPMGTTGFPQQYPNPLPSGYRPGNTNRCPGAGTQLAPDKSNQVTPTTTKCDQKQRPS